MQDAALQTAPDAAAPLWRERARARLKKLTLTDFRSYALAEIPLDGRPAAFVGPNGAGKTNILEAISLFGPGRGLRRARLDELPRAGGAGGWAAAARLDDGEDERLLGVGAEAGRPERRVCRIDQRAAAGPGVFTRLLRFLWLTPAQDRLFADAAGERRRFIDRMALAFDPAHGEASSAYEEAMRKRQRLLETGRPDPAWLAAVERQMAEAGVAVAAARREVISHLEAAEVADAESVFPAADMALAGDLETALEMHKAADVEDEFASDLQRSRRRDSEAGRALFGPHRSDLRVAHRAKGQPARLCSTGEQKALLIGLVLANARALQRRGDGAPLFLLLDEIAAHLDAPRRAALFDILEELDIQAVMTGTDKSLFDAWGPRAQHFEVSGGAVREFTA